MIFHSTFFECFCEGERGGGKQMQVTKVCQLKARVILECLGHLPSGQLIMMPSGHFSKSREAGRDVGFIPISGSLLFFLQHNRISPLLTV